MKVVIIIAMTINGITKYMVRGYTDEFYETYEDAIDHAAEKAHIAAMSLRCPIELDDRVVQ